MNTVNTTLEWPLKRYPDKIIKFYLVRAKVQFEYTYTKDGVLQRRPVGGELIDVSFPHRDDFRLRHFLKNYERSIADYQLTLEETGETFAMKAESLLGLEDDLFEVVFDQYNRPWEDRKYQKRINRLFFLATVDMLGSLGLGSKTAQSYLDAVAQRIMAPLDCLLSRGDDEASKVAKQITRDTKAIAAKYPEMAGANRVLGAVSNLVLEIADSAADDDKNEFSEFLGTVKENLNVMSQLAKMQPRKINIASVYNARMSSFY